MVKNTIKVYARIKREINKLNDALYEVIRHNEYEDLIIYSRQDNIVKSNTQTFRKYRFHKIFNQASKQTEVFDDIAKPVVTSVLHGFNGTIFAYGQCIAHNFLNMRERYALSNKTGSGKTYSITGSPNKYKHRGLIPRTIEEIFDFTTKSAEKYAIYISYLEIYNEIGYDLLNPKQKASSLEELPRVFLLEDMKGEAHLKNLSLVPVSTEQDAMRLLFLGDTNRSERVHKAKISGTILAEAKSINLSLLYLEQVIMALSESNRPHIPFRNSMMTFVLKDSLIGNSLTVMLATLSPKLTNIEETISTCKFAQRVSLVNIQAFVNEESDPQHELTFLRNEIVELRKQLHDKSMPKKEEKLTSNEKKYCQQLIKNYLDGGDDKIHTETDIRLLRQCIVLLKTEFEHTEEEIVVDDVVRKYKEIVKQKDEEITILNSLLENKVEPDAEKICVNKSTSHTKVAKSEKQLFDEFMSDQSQQSKIEFYMRTLQEKCLNAKIITKVIRDVQSEIMRIRIEMHKAEDDQIDRLTFELKSQQNIYRESLLRLQNLKNETEFLNHGLYKAKIRVMQDFRQHCKEKYNTKIKFKLDDFDNFFGKSESMTSSSSIENTFEGFQSEYNKYVHFDEKITDEVQFPSPSTTSNVLKLYSNMDLQSSSNMIANNLKESNSKSHNVVKYTNTSIGQFDINKKLDKLLNEKPETSTIFPKRNNDKDLLTSLGTVSTEPIKFIEASPIITARVHEMKPSISNHFEKHNIYKNPVEAASEIKLCTKKPFQDNLTFNLNTRTHSRSNQGTNIDIATSTQSKVPPQTFPFSENVASSTNNDSAEFTAFIKTVPLTGDSEVDDEIIKFYRLKFK